MLKGRRRRAGGDHPKRGHQRTKMYNVISEPTHSHTHTLTKHKANTPETLFTEYLYVYYVGRDVAYVLVSTKRLMAAKRQRIVYIR